MLPITEKLLDNYNRPGLHLKKLKALIIHWTANTRPGATAMRNRDYFNTQPEILDARGNRVYASAHYVVDDHSIVRCVPDHEVAYHVGAVWGRYTSKALELMGLPPGAPRNGDSPNHYTVGIEICVNADGDFSKARQHTLELAARLMQQYGLKIHQVLRHYDITGKDCPRMMLEPGVWRQFLKELSALVVSKAEVKPGKPVPKPSPKPLPDPSHTPVALVVRGAASVAVRKGPGTSFELLRREPEGTPLKGYEQKTGWYRIHRDRQEWIFSVYVKRVP